MTGNAGGPSLVYPHPYRLDGVSQRELVFMQFFEQVRQLRVGWHGNISSGEM
ncbi:hypothetical protein UCMB321_3084 [Pseudomonas batumici]|uniref:Uncharacterized protein n=1 Tax=Pseudomonas batumici TaxID=226910 RepID=A0A0C2EBB1_9PSED|nr:hypothetical protein UCMB321_3084 [Pseudomonas batumici]